VSTSSIIRAMIMVTASTSETSVILYQTARHKNAEHGHFQTRRRENLKSYNGDIPRLYNTRHENKYNFCSKLSSINVFRKRAFLFFCGIHGSYHWKGYKLHYLISAYTSGWWSCVVVRGFWDNITTVAMVMLLMGTYYMHVKQTGIVITTSI
jgi:hypothetical protein